MIRFIPDTLRDWVMRPVAMAAPDAFVYVELHAPDFRFVLVLLLMLALTACAFKFKSTVPPSLKVMTATIWLAFIPWMASSGNGRYFVPMLLGIGVVLVALVYHLPLSRSLRGAFVVMVVAVQGFVVFDVRQLDRWGYIPWLEAPYFEIQPTPGITDTPHSFVTVTQISYSLVTPQFHPASRWMSLAYLPAQDSGRFEAVKVKSFINAATSLKLVIHTVPSATLPSGQPNANLVNNLNGELALQRLQIVAGEPCTLVRSRGVALLSYPVPDITDARLARSGFWVCPLRMLSDSTQVPTVSITDEKINEAIGKLEAACPRLFPPGQTSVVRIAGGVRRSYSSSDMVILVLDGIGVVYKYWHALNPAFVGTEEQVRKGEFKLDCNNVRGRSGLPWEREI